LKSFSINKKAQLVAAPSYPFIEMFGPEKFTPETRKARPVRLRFLGFLTLYLFYQVGQGKVDKIQTLFLLAND